MPGPIYTAPPNAGTVVLGQTLPQLLYDACDRLDNPRAFNQPAGDTWTPTSLHAFRVQSEEVALGLLDLGLDRGDRVAFLMKSDVRFCLADMGCLLAGLVDVPIYLSHEAAQIRYVIDHAEARAVAVSGLDELRQLAPLLPDLPRVATVLIATPPDADAADMPALPDGVALVPLDEVRRRGRATTTDLDGDIAALRAQIDPHDLATLIYTSGTTGQPKGVMLSHENISFDALTAFSGIPAFVLGDPEQTVLSFLPLTHIFARALHYGYMAYGMSVYFTTPQDVARALKAVRPTAFATVPRVLEKVYTSIRQKIMEMEGLQKRIGTWSLGVARRYELGERPPLTYRLEQALADALVFSKWREALGGRVQLVVVGGAALSPELANVFGAAGIIAVQGYGLTETSPVITYNRPGRNHAGTVGEPMAGVEVRLADDGEILTRGPHVMMGYYKDQAKTAEVLSPDGWFHTGDIGAFTETGLLRITDRKKALFKLSTGKYVIPQPIENALADDALIDRAVVMGTGHKFCTALIFPAEDALRAWAREQGLDADLTLDRLVQLDEVTAHYQAAISDANEGMDRWSTVKRFAVVPDELTVASGLLTPTMKVKRRAIRETFAATLDALYDDADVAEARAATAAAAR